MKVLVTGGSGQLGHDVRELLTKEGHSVYAPTHREMDITDEESISSYFLSSSPKIVVHCAAWTNVDSAETNERECMAVNHLGTKKLVNICKKCNVPIVYISTDYVFDGNGIKPWSIHDKENPQNIYGLSKYLGELEVRKFKKHFIIRISWVFGINGNNFVKTMIRLSKKMNEISVVSDQFGSPTYTRDVSVLIKDMIGTDKYGTYHACNQGSCSWAQFAEKIFELINADTKVNHISSEEWKSVVKRPKNSILETSSLATNGFDPLPSWEDALKRYLTELKDLKEL